MFYTTNSSPMLVTELVFILTNILKKKISIVSGAFNASCLAILNHFLKSCNIIQMGTGVKVRFISEPQVWM